MCWHCVINMTRFVVYFQAVRALCAFEKLIKNFILFFIVLCSVQAATWRKLFQQQKSSAKRVLERDLCCCCCSCCFSSAASTLKSSIRPSPLLFALRPVHHTRSLSRTLSLSSSLTSWSWMGEQQSTVGLFQLVYKCAAYLNLLLLLLFVYFAFSAIGNWNWNFFSVESLP